MGFSIRKLFAATGVIASVATATAGPPPGLRWSDAVGHPSTATPRTSPFYVRPIGSPVMTGTPSAPAGTAITVRGPDGVLRTYPVVGSAVVTQGQGAQSVVTTPVPAPLPATPAPKK